MRTYTSTFLWGVGALMLGLGLSVHDGRGVLLGVVLIAIAQLIDRE